MNKGRVIRKSTIAPIVNYVRQEIDSLKTIPSYIMIGNDVFNELPRKEKEGINNPNELVAIYGIPVKRRRSKGIEVVCD